MNGDSCVGVNIPIKKIRNEYIAHLNGRFQRNPIRAIAYCCSLPCHSISINPANKNKRYNALTHSGKFGYCKKRRR